ncbi:MAG TPA: alpha-amylase family glycosyl hydrolase [Jatrophihabitans sp.]|jgi:oligo-1,6-glucosidase
MDSSQATWWQSAVVYQVYPRSFCDANGDGVGDLAGITTRLDYLQRLGVDVLWLSPIFPSPQDDAGYDISDYCDVDPVFGSLADFDHLLAEVHRRGMRLVLDLVVNHTSDEHPWFQQSRRGKDAAYRDWYWWRGPRPGMAPGAPGAEPTNWGSAFSGSAWQFDEASGEYYLHLFSRKQPDLNWENPEVRSAVHAMMRWWLDRGVDGFRMDVINMISKDPRLPDGPVRSGAYGDGSPHYICGPRIHEFLQEMNQQVFAGRDGKSLTVGEMPGVTVEQARLFTDPARPGTSSTWCSSSSTCNWTRASTSSTRPASSCWTSRRASDAGRPAWPRSAGTACTGTTTTSPGWCRASAMTASSTGSCRPRCWPPCCTCTAEPPTSTRAKSSP